MTEGPQGVRLGTLRGGELVRKGIPVEQYQCGGVPVFVKREDLCSPLPGPQFSKIRGLVPHLEGRPERNIGILDTFHSKAGWATAYVCAALGKHAIIFYPRYKGDWQLELSTGIQRGGPDTLRVQQVSAESFGAELVPLQATAGYILEIRAKKLLAERENSYMLPVGLKMPESVTENAAEALRTVNLVPQLGSLVISVSSGTVASGVIRGFAEACRSPEKIICHLGYSRPVEGKKGLRANMEHKANWPMDRVEYVDEKYNYKDPARGRMRGKDDPFPLNPYYDAKAWKWLQVNAANLPKPILFWNVGA